HDHRRNLADAVHVAQQLVLVGEEAAVDEVVAFDAGEGQRELVLVVRADAGRILVQVTGGPLPYRPGACRRDAHRRVVAGEAAVVGADQVAALDLGNRGEVGFPRIRIQRVAALLVEPFQFPAAQHEDAAQHQLGDLVRMRLRVGQRQGGTPGTAEHLPAGYAQVLAHAFDVGHQVPGRVLAQFRVRGGLAATALVEQYDAIDGRVEEAPALRVGAAARTAVQEHHRLAVRIAALLVVQRVQFRDLERAAVVGFDFGIQRATFLRHGRVQSGDDRFTRSRWIARSPKRLTRPFTGQPRLAVRAPLSCPFRMKDWAPVILLPRARMYPIRLTSLFALALAFIAPTTLPAAPAPATHATHAMLQNQLEALATRAQPGVLGIVVLDPQSGERWQVNAGRAYPMMSVFKAPVAAAVFARIDSGALSMEQ